MIAFGWTQFPPVCNNQCTQIKAPLVRLTIIWFINVMEELAKMIAELLFVMFENPWRIDEVTEYQKKERKGMEEDSENYKGVNLISILAKACEQIIKKLLFAFD